MCVYVNVSYLITCTMSLLSRHTHVHTHEIITHTFTYTPKHTHRHTHTHTQNDVMRIPHLSGRALRGLIHAGLPRTHERFICVN